MMRASFTDQPVGATTKVLSHEDTQFGIRSSTRTTKTTERQVDISVCLAPGADAVEFTVSRRNSCFYPSTEVVDLREYISSEGARRLAARLLEAADEVDRITRGAK